jgi:hypothetical protein
MNIAFLQASISHTELSVLAGSKRLKSSPKTRDHVTNEHFTIFYVDIQKLVFDSPYTLDFASKTLFIFFAYIFSFDVKYDFIWGEIPF